ncbi:MAG: GNAT family N-acetyltransferase [Bacteroidota bacterium]
MLEITLVHQIPFPGFSELKEQSKLEGYRFVIRLEREWESGQNTYNQAGEGLFKVVAHHQIVGVGGINHDPYSNDRKIGRIRRFYILPSWRNQGIGTALLEHILRTKGSEYAMIQLRTDSELGSKFYERNGFSKVEHKAHYTHQLLVADTGGYLS